MKKNFVVEILHATKKLVSPRGDIEDLNSDTIKARLITATETLTSEKDLKVVGKDGTATIRDLDVTDTADVENRLTVKNDTKTKNLEVAPDEKGKGGNATIHNAIIKSLDNASQAWATDKNGGKAEDLITDLNESNKPQPKNKNVSSAGTSTKVARADHTHKIPNSIKNPKRLIIRGVNVGEDTPQHPYDGSECTTSDKYGDGDTLLDIDYNFTGAAKKNHADSTSVFGVGNANMYGHTKLYDMGFYSYNRNNDSSNETIIADAKNFDVNQGTALTPRALANYASYFKEYVHGNFIEKPRNPGDDVTIDGKVHFTGDVEINKELHCNGRIKIKNSGYIDGSSSSPSDNTIKIYGIGTDTIGKLQFGNTNKNTVLRSNNDGHLYIEHDDGSISKLMDYEIEAIITSNSLSHNKIWTPSKAGLYRIYLIGGGGFGTPGGVYNKHNAKAAPDEGDTTENHWSVKTTQGPKAGYGLGQAMSGIGGGGAPVVRIDLLTKNADNAGGDDGESGEDDESDSETSNGEDDEMDKDDIGARFVFIRTHVYYTGRIGSSPKVTHRFSTTVENEDGSTTSKWFAPVRCIGVQGLSTIGTIINSKGGTLNGSIAPSFNSVKYALQLVDTVSVDSKKEAKSVVFDAFVGHGEDAGMTDGHFTDGTASDGPVTATNNNEVKDVDKGNGVKGSRYIITDPTANLMYGGTEHYKGSNGYSYKRGESLDYNFSEVMKSEYKEGGVTYYACQVGCDGGWPGRKDVTGTTLGKGSPGAINTKKGRKSTDKSKTPVYQYGGHGASFELAEYDKYNGSIAHSDRTAKANQLRRPLRASKVGGYGYYGGGHGGGGATIINTSTKGAVTSSKYSQAANEHKTANEPCVVIVYLGKK